MYIKKFLKWSLILVAFLAFKYIEGHDAPDREGSRVTYLVSE